jgi:hypothetical protein
MRADAVNRRHWMIGHFLAGSFLAWAFWFGLGLVVAEFRQRETSARAIRALESIPYWHEVGRMSDRE